MCTIYSTAIPLKAFLNCGYLGHSNLKIESVAADCTDDRLLALVCAVAVLYQPPGDHAILMILAAF